MRILFVGDIYSKSGRNAAFTYIKPIKEKYNIDLVIANGENSCNGKSMSNKTYAELKNAGVDVFTMGNHYLQNNEIHALLRNKKDIVRPLNIEGNYEGSGSIVIDVKGIKVRISNMLGRVYMRGFTFTNPFYAIDEVIKYSEEKIHILDFHAEATGEKKSLAKYLDGRISAIIGTHTHVQTADNQIFKKGSAYISDVGFCGAYDSVLGVENMDAIAYSKDQDFSSHKSAKGDEIEFSAVYLDIDETTGLANKIKRIYITPGREEIKLID